MAAPRTLGLLFASSLTLAGCGPAVPTTVADAATPAPTAPAPTTYAGRVADTPSPPASPHDATPFGGSLPIAADPGLTSPTPLRDLADLARRLRLQTVDPVSPSAEYGSPERQVGAQERFWIADQARRTYFPVTATLRYKTDHLYMYVQDGQQCDVAGVRKAADDFERIILPTDERVFGDLRIRGPDLDSRVSVINGNVPGVSGYFSSNDAYPSAVMPFSNQRLAVYANLRSVQPGSDSYAGMLAHELQHLIEFGTRPHADAWLNEGASMLAQGINGLPLGAGIPHAFFAHPDTQLTSWESEPAANTPHYAASYLWLRYFTARFGGPGIMRSILASRKSDLGAFDDLLQRRGESERLADVFADWSVANYLNDVTLGDGRYGYRDLDGHAVKTGVASSGAPYEGRLRPYASNYVVIPGAGGSTIHFQGRATTPLMPHAPSGAPFEWWSNRGDKMDATLTRSLDLSRVTTAHLSYDIWYDIETDFDYGYVEVSTDGETWSTLSTNYTTSKNPNGSSDGAGYTGASGDPRVVGSGQRAPSWIHETIDLSPYAGRVVSLRFEYVTDDSYTGPGIAVANLSIPEIGWNDDPESPDGWSRQGWLATNNRVPQEFRVQLISFGDVPRVLQVPLDHTEEGSIVIPDGSGESVLVVNAFAPKTTELSSYEVTVEAPRAG